MNVAYNVLQVWKMLNKIHQMDLILWCLICRSMGYVHMYKQWPLYLQWLYMLNTWFHIKCHVYYTLVYTKKFKRNWLKCSFLFKLTLILNMSPLHLKGLQFIFIFFHCFINMGHWRGNVGVLHLSKPLVHLSVERQPFFSHHRHFNVLTIFVL